MPEYRRSRVSGGTYFFTLVSGRRRPILTEPQSRLALRSAIEEIRESLPFSISAWVLLPDHLHCIWTLPDGDSDYSKRWGKIKTCYSRRMGALGINNRHESGLWQRRFWEHRIRDQNDLNNHINYIHINPLKHGIVTAVKDWPYSTFHRYVREGIYPLDWGGDVIIPDISAGE